VADSDPFRDAIFVGRLLKLLPMLGSEQPGEAEAARRKLREHLAHHRLTFLDVAQRLGGTGASSGPSARVESLERQLAAARAAKDDAARDANYAGARVRSLEAELESATAAISQAMQSQGRIRAAAAVGWSLVIVIVAVAFGPALIRNGRLAPLMAGAGDSSTMNLSGPIAAQVRAPADTDLSLHLQNGERPGRAAVQDLPIRLSPNDDATVRAFLNQGEHVAIRQEVQANGRTWLLIRTATGTGWVRNGDVLH
jgi:hypothetical protein